MLLLAHNHNMKEFIRKINKNNGIATLEMLIAMTIIVMAISTVIMLVFGSQSTSVASQTNQEALYKAQKQIEDARATARANFDSVVTIAPSNDGIYTKSVTVTSSADGLTKQITSLVIWG